MAQCLGDSVWPRVCTLLLSSSRLVLCEGESGQRCRLEGDVCSVWQQVVLKQLQSSVKNLIHITIENFRRALFLFVKKKNLI